MNTDNTPSPYYRVASRALILDEQNRLLVMQNHDGNYELPGGGWEHNETFAAGLQREIVEELGVELAEYDPAIVCIYRGRSRHGKMFMRLAVRATLKSYEFKPVDMSRAFWVTRMEFMKLDLQPTAEEELKQYADIIWSTT